MRMFVRAGVVALTLAQPLFAAKPDKKAAAAAKKDEPKEVQLDTAQSKMNWKGTKKVGSAHNGTINIKSGKLWLKGDKITGGEFIVDMHSIKDLDLTDQEYNTKLVTHLKSADFFDVEKFPESKFVIKSVTGSKVTGDLRILEATQPISFNTNIKKDGAVWRATTPNPISVDRTKWGLKYGSKSFFKELVGDKIINDKFEITFDLVTAAAH